jgi:3-oxoacid CoA-transferase A subunit
MDKVVEKAEKAIEDIEDGATIAVAGFFAAGVPRVLLRALIAKGTRDLTLACGAGPLLGAVDELRQLVRKKQIRKVIDSYGLFRSATKGIQELFEQEIRAGRIELQVYPMGTLSEKYRAGGAGIPAFFTPVGAGSMVEETTLTNIGTNRVKRETRVIGGRTCLLEYALKPDFAFVHAHMGDPEGNLRYRKTARNFNHVMATAARVTIAEVEDLVSTGGIDPDIIHTAGIFVQRVVEVGLTPFTLTDL